jgi:N,N'-diacetylchitobiose phosphorylase
MEPYAYAQFITGRDHPYDFGRARNSWLTGTATWAFVAISQYILGIMPSYDGLTLNPQIPESWSGFSANRRYRGANYQIHVEGSGSVSEVFVNGKPVSFLPGQRLVLPVAPPLATVQVRLLCGSEASAKVAE